MESMENQNKIWKGTNFWKEEIKKAGVLDKLKFFSDVITENRAPLSYGDPVITDVVLDGVVCDIYHTDKKPNDTGCRIFIHKKESTEN
ncbi:MAG TPA: hypothetical protein DCS08_03060 [Candidatus Moranbacteria bacterium]|nr:hypothetical protein [Candidatus Moranbacteria bacterium]